jgi:hypothetical protein
MNNCKIEGCNRPVRVKARQLCLNHYTSLIRDPNVPLLVKRPVALCSVPGCPNKNYAKALCQMHFMRMRQTGTTDLRPHAPRQPAPCLAGCGRPAAALGWCKAHYTRNSTTGQVGGPDIRPQKLNGHVGYSMARRVLNEVRGFAKEHGCVDCTKTATGWTLRPDAWVYRETEGQYAGLPYSLEVWQYEPRCRYHKREHNEQHGHGRSQV